VGVRELLQLDQLQLLERDFLALRLRHTLHLQPESDVAERRTPGKELGEVLEDDAAVHAIAGHRLTANAHLAIGGSEEPGDDVEQRRLPAAAGADETQELG